MAVAFAFVAGVSPIIGLQTAAVMGFFAATFGGRGGIGEDDAAVVVESAGREFARGISRARVERANVREV